MLSFLEKCIYALIWRKIDTLYSNKTYKKYAMPFIHGTTMICASAYQVANLSSLSDDSQHEMTSFQKRILNISSGYFMYDFFNMLSERHMLYTAHHIIALLFFGLLEKYNYGKIYMYALFLGEITNPCLNIWTFTKERKMTRSFSVINHIFSPTFVLIRGICMPYFFVKSLNKIIRDDDMSQIDFATMCTLSLLFNISNFVWMKSLVYGYLKYGFTRRNNLAK